MSAQEVNDRKVNSYINSVAERSNDYTAGKEVIAQEPSGGISGHLDDVFAELKVIGPILLVIVGTIGITTGLMWLIKKIMKKLGIKNKKLDLALAAIIGFITFGVLKKFMQDENMEEMVKNLYDGANEAIHDGDGSMLESLTEIKIPTTEKKE